MAGASVAPTVMLVGETKAVRVAQSFDVKEKADLDAVAPVISMMGLVDLVDPPHGVQVVKYLSWERYISASNFMEIDDFDEGGANAPVYLTPLARMDSPEEAVKVATKVRQGGALKHSRT